jgi:hypothetical protein
MVLESAALPPICGISTQLRWRYGAGFTSTDASADAPVLGFVTTALYVPVITFCVFVNVYEPVPSAPIEMS